MSNLASLIVDAAREHPHAKFGTCSQHDRLDRVVDRARAVAGALNAAGLGRGDVVAMIGPNSGAYLVTWMATQLAGVASALINPAYPDEFLRPMLDALQPKGLLWIGRDPGAMASRPCIQLVATGAWDSELRILRAGAEVAASSGLECRSHDIASFAHTSGTTGLPKFCALSHGYFLRVARFFVDSLCVSSRDTVLAPLPLFHVNPLGYGVVGSLTARAAMLSMERFTASEFWSEVRRHQVTALVLHAPPVSLLKAKTTEKDASGHQVRIGFLCDPAFLRQFGVPIGVSGYGSTEAAGLCHTWHIRPGDDDLPPEGATHMAGRPRHDIEVRIDSNDEILVKGRHPDVLFSGYVRDGRIEPCVDADGWFRTGDRGRLDESGNLVFVERMSDSIRVNGEYVPIGLVEARLQRVQSLGEFALWRVDSASRGHEVVLYTTSAAVNPGELRLALADLPAYMHPQRLIRIERLPRDAGVGKVQRRLLESQARLAEDAIG